MNFKKNNWFSMSDSVIVKEICRNIKQMRLNQNISQAHLAELSGLSRITIGRLESGMAVNMLTIVQILRAMNKLDILDSFREEEMISPIRMLRMQEKQRSRSSQSRKKKEKNKNADSEW